MGAVWGSSSRLTVEREGHEDNIKVFESRHHQTSSGTSDSGAVNEMRAEGTDEDLDRLKEVYSSRIHELEKRNAELYQASLSELNRIVKNVEEKYLKSSADPVCGELRDAAMRCYSSNHKSSLNCSADVRAFVNCVQSHREKMMLK